MNSLSFLLAISAAGSAQTQAISDPIIVEGQRLPSVHQALDAVNDITGSVESQLVRYSRPVCPRVIGVMPDEAAKLEARMRLMATRTGISVAEADCEPNLLFAIVPDGGKFVTELRKERPQWFAGISPREVNRLAQEPHARAWSTTSLVNDDGRTTGKGGAAIPAQNQYERSGNDNLASARQIQVRSPSIFRKQSRYVINGSVVVMDAAAASKLTIRQMADYALLRGAAKTRPPRDSAQLFSILNVFDFPPKAAPRELTKFDQAYLRELYRRANQKGYEAAVHERLRIATAIAGGR